MRTSIIRSAALIALAVAFAPAAAMADKQADKQIEKKEVQRFVVVKDGKVITSDDPVVVRRFATRGYLGVQMLDLTPELREHFHVSKDAGVIVSKVVPDSPAAKAGLRVGDIITSIEGVRVDSPGDLTRAVRNKKKGESVRIEYSRDGVNGTAMAAVAERERPEVDLGDLNIQIPDIPDVGRHLETYFNSPEWKAKMDRLQNLPDCSDMQQRMRDVEKKMKDLEKRLGQK